MERQIIVLLKTFPKISETFIAQELCNMLTNGYQLKIYARIRPKEEKFFQRSAQQLLPFVTYIPHTKKDIHHYIFRILKYVLHYKKPSYIYHLYRYTKERSKTDVYKRSVLSFYAALWIIYDLKLFDNPEKYHIHAQFLDYPSEIAYYIHEMTGVTYSISCHAKDIYTSPEEDIKKFISSSVKVKTCTNYNYNYLCSHTDHKDKLNVIYHGINNSFFDLTKTQNSLHLITVARLVEKKGYFDILKALDILKIRYPNFVYTIVGHGELQQSINDYISFLHLEKNVSLIPYANDIAVRELLYRSDIFINASVIPKNGDRDGIPNSIAEAMAMEVPIIATNISGISEIVKHMETGFLVNSRDAMSIYNAIVYYMEHPDIRKTITQNAKKNIMEIFDQEKCFKKCDEFYNNCLNYEK